ncbi:methylthioadenosine phosphorylase [Halobiforma lacisalsi AJ5]|uniref:Purine nucleoside phosphorylase n=2 Tax=Natronobacterium TaxID=2256 RepID=M0LE57_NATLA|nr:MULTISPECIES: S-methyl-5'-thioadenosine phosphorylase [Halobiforma]APW96367.1 methylthioadenosine phosphorylase [Halobiforma lacisalsi AJ5]EMA31866.1 methylthioadenosine phosphorylase [Halobiforma lacisalsi AJ5]SFB72028.1 5'-methylthioadenosine phosphorylase [Halobiforma haloterrestris]
MTIGVIGGSGIYEALPLENTRKEEVSTPYGEPSEAVTLGELAGKDVAFLPRHGEDHQHTPTDAQYRANIYALKSVGVDRVIATNAVGSLREDLPPRTLVVPDQIFDRTKHRQPSFFGDGMVVHMGFADPYCPEMVDHLATAAEEATEDTKTEAGGTYVCIEGPQYSTRAESEFYRDQGWDIVGMTAIPEAKLAREAELSYATVAGVTDYDVWKADNEVTLEEVLENAEANQEAINRVVEHAIRTMPEDFESDAWSALEGTINTPADAIPEETRERVDLLAGKYLE